MKKIILLIALIFLLSSCSSKMEDLSDQSMQVQDVELDLDLNGSIDISRGGHNAATAAGARTNLDVYSTVEVDAFLEGISDEVVYQSNCSIITNGLCIDTDDGQLWYYNATTSTVVEGSGLVDSVNGQTGVVVLDSDDINDSTSILKKFVTQALIDKVATIETNAAGDQTATQVPFTPYSTISSTNVQGAIQEVLDTVPGSQTAAQTAFTPFSTIAATNTQAAIEEVFNEAAGGSGITDVESDTSPTLGGNLDAASFNITSVGSLTVNASSLPSVTLKNSNLLGADKYASSIESPSTTNTDGGEVTDLNLYFMDAGTKALGAQIDGSSQEFKYNLDVNPKFTPYHECIALSSYLDSPVIGAVELLRAPYAFEITDVRIQLSASTQGDKVIVDIREEGSSIFSTKVSIDSTEKTSVTSAIPYVLSDTSIADDAILTFYVDQVGSSYAGSGLKACIYGSIR